MMMNGPQDSGFDVNPVWAAVVAIGAVFFAWVKRVNPLPGVQWLASAINGPVLEKHFEKHIAPRFDGLEKKVDSHDSKLDKVCRVIDYMPGAKEAHAAVKADEERWKQ